MQDVVLSFTNFIYVSIEFLKRKEMWMVKLRFTET